MEMVMEIRVERGSAEKYSCELLILFAFEFPEPLEGPIKSVDLEWKGFISSLMNQGDFKGELFERRLFYTQGALPAKRILLTGLGKRGEFDLEKWRGAASKAGQYLRDAGIKKFALQIKKFDRFAEEELAESFMTGLQLGTYQYNELKTLEREKIKEIDAGIILGETAFELKLLNNGMETGRIIAEAVCGARDLVNGPSNKITPTLLSEKAQQIAKDHGMEIQVLEVSQAEAMGMGAFTAVAKGSQEPGKFIVLEYNKGNGFDTIALVGKGITFDSGGISIKPSEGMERMKDDMSGAAAVLAMMQAAPG